jgi:hypothetical protein
MKAMDRDTGAWAMSLPRSGPPPEEEALCELHEHRREAESVGSWHYVAMMRQTLPRETHAEWASRMLGREVKFLEDCTREELETLKRALRNAEPKEKA